MTIKEENTFQARLNFNGRTLYDLLGGENIETDSIAIAEQIKNAQDANASEIIIDLSKIDKDLITITDNGDGMNMQEIRDDWLTIGTNSKMNAPTKLGGKGVGRFSLFRLGDVITVETIKDYKRYSFTIDKHQLDTISNISIQQEESTSRVTGTKIILTKINKYINLHEIELGLENLVHPKSTRIHKILYPKTYQQKNYTLSNDWLKLAPFYAEAKIEGMNIKEYKFKCTVSDNILYENKTIENRLLNSLQEVLEKNNAANINLGPIKIKIHNFYFDRTYLKHHKAINKSDIQNKMLKAYQGLTVYRNGYKVYGHGEEDWLKLAELRLQRPGDNIDNKLTYGIVTLDSMNSLYLKEKTNREGFIKSREYKYFHEVVLSIVKQVGYDRKKSVRIIKDLINNNSFEELFESRKDTPKKSDNEDACDLSKDELVEEVNSKIKGNSKEKAAITTSESDKDEIIKKDKTPKGSQEEPLEPISPKPKARQPLSSKIIDISYEYPKETPEKIKLVIDELKTITNKNIIAQALLLRCLIDITTQYYQKTNEIEITNNNLPSNVTKVLNKLAERKSLDHKSITRIRQSVNKEASLQYFNGVAHEYNYRPNFSDIKELWNTFEPFITVCLSNKGSLD